MKIAMDNMLTPREAANWLRCSKRSLERLRLSGQGPRYVKCQRKVLYRSEDLHAWVTARIVQSTSERTADEYRGKTCGDTK